MTSRLVCYLLTVPRSPPATAKKAAQLRFNFPTVHYYGDPSTGDDDALSMLRVNCYLELAPCALKRGLHGNVRSGGVEQHLQLAA